MTPCSDSTARSCGATVAYVVRDIGGFDHVEVDAAAIAAALLALAQSAEVDVRGIGREVGIGVRSLVGSVLKMPWIASTGCGSQLSLAVAVKPTFCRSWLAGQSSVTAPMVTTAEWYR